MSEKKYKQPVQVGDEIEVDIINLGDEDRDWETKIYIISFPNNSVIAIQNSASNPIPLPKILAIVYAIAPITTARNKKALIAVLMNCHLYFFFCSSVKCSVISSSNTT